MGCIHQTNPYLKQKGIEQVGAIVGHSKQMLVTWDSTYFDRLWCTYEMSAKFHADQKHTKPRVIVLPIVLGGFVAAYLCATLFGDISTWLAQSLINTDMFSTTLSSTKWSTMFHFPCFLL